MDDLITWLNSEMEERGWSNNELARRAGLSSGGVSLVLSGSRKPTHGFCVAVARALREPPEKVLRLAGLLPPLPSVEDKSYWELVELAKELTRVERLEIYDLMRWKYQTRRQDEGSLPPKDMGSNKPGNAEDARATVKGSDE